MSVWVFDWMEQFEGIQWKKKFGKYENKHNKETVYIRSKSTGTNTLSILSSMFERTGMVDIDFSIGCLENKVLRIEAWISCFQLFQNLKRIPTAFFSIRMKRKYKFRLNKESLLKTLGAYEEASHSKCKERNVIFQKKIHHCYLYFHMRRKTNSVAFVSFSQ